jgi:hypothetical protein
MPRLAVDLDVIRHALFDRSLSQVGSELADVRITRPVSVGAIELESDARLAIKVFNAKDDRDEDSVFGSGQAAHIRYTPASVWVKYAVEAEASGTMRFGRSSTASRRRIELHDYRVHPAADGAVRAVRRDLESFRAILQIGDVRKLRAGEALSMDLPGTLTATAEVSWPDVLSSRLGVILRAAGITIPVAVRLSRTARAGAVLRIADQFTVVISRNEDGHLRFAVRKSASRSSSVGIDLALGGEINAARSLDAALEPVFEAVAGASLAAVRRISAAPVPGDLSLEDREVLEMIARRLGLGTIASREKAVIAAIDRIRRMLRSELEKALRWKFSAGFSFEYSRIDDGEAIIDYLLLDESLLSEDHRDVIAGDLGAMRTRLLEDRGGRKLLKYLDRRTVGSSAALGFSLGVGDWIDIQAKEERKFRQTTRRGLDGRSLVSCVSRHTYEEKGIPENDFEWTVELKGDMREFRASPSSRDFHCGLHCAVTLERHQLSEADFDRMLDFAAMWGIQLPAGSPLLDAVGRHAVIRVQFLLDRGDLASVIAASPRTGWSRALAAAMPYMSRFPERCTVDARTRTYEKAWQMWLDRPDSSPSDWFSPQAHLDLRDGLRTLEERALPGSFRWMAGEGHPHLRRHLESFERGLLRLHELTTRDEPPAAFSDVCRMLEGFWTQRFYVAAAGVYLLDRAAAAGVTPERTMQLEFGDETVTF